MTEKNKSLVKDVLCTVGNVLKSTGQALGNLVKSTCGYLDAKRQVQQQQVFAQQNQLIQQQKQQQQADLAQRVNYVMENVARELFEVFKTQSYYYLRTLVSPSSLRFSGYRCVNGMAVFSYAIQKSIISVFTVDDLSRIKYSMNEDIRRFINQMKWTYNQDVILFNLPYISYGLAVCDVIDRKDCVIINVVSNYATRQLNG